MVVADRYHFVTIDQVSDVVAGGGNRGFSTIWLSFFAIIILLSMHLEYVLLRQLQIHVYLLLLHTLSQTSKHYSFDKEERAKLRDPTLFS